MRHVPRTDRRAIANALPTRKLTLHQRHGNFPGGHLRTTRTRTACSPGGQRTLSRDAIRWAIPPWRHLRPWRDKSNVTPLFNKSRTQAKCYTQWMQAGDGAFFLRVGGFCRLERDNPVLVPGRVRLHPGHSGAVRAANTRAGEVTCGLTSSSGCEESSSGALCGPPRRPVEPEMAAQRTRREAPLGGTVHQSEPLCQSRDRNGGWAHLAK
jgi:hypothetical protein